MFRSRSLDHIGTPYLYLEATSRLAATIASCPAPSSLPTGVTASGIGRSLGWMSVTARTSALLAAVAVLQPLIYGYSQGK
jgi:hypothetical protein